VSSHGAQGAYTHDEIKKKVVYASDEKIRINKI
jgi:hypothetical protein